MHKTKKFRPENYFKKLADNSNHLSCSVSTPRMQGNSSLLIKAKFWDMFPLESSPSFAGFVSCHVGGHCGNNRECWAQPVASGTHGYTVLDAVGHSCDLGWSLLIICCAVMRCHICSAQHTIICKDHELRGTISKPMSRTHRNFKVLGRCFFPWTRVCWWVLANRCQNLCVVSNWLKSNCYSRCELWAMVVWLIVMNVFMKVCVPKVHMSAWLHLSVHILHLCCWGSLSFQYVMSNLRSMSFVDLL